MQELYLSHCGFAEGGFPLGAGGGGAPEEIGWAGGGSREGASRAWTA